MIMIIALKIIVRYFRPVKCKPFTQGVRLLYRHLIFVAVGGSTVLYTVSKGNVATTCFRDFLRNSMPVFCLEQALFSQTDHNC